MERSDIEFNYSDAAFFDETSEGVPSEAIFEYLFEDRKSAAGELIKMVNDPSTDVSIPDMPLDVSEVSVRERDGDNDCLDIHVRIHGLTVGTQIGGKHSVMLFNKNLGLEDYQKFRVAVKPA